MLRILIKKEVSKNDKLEISAYDGVFQSEIDEKVLIFYNTNIYKNISGAVLVDLQSEYKCLEVLHDLTVKEYADLRNYTYETLSHTEIFKHGVGRDMT